MKHFPVSAAFLVVAGCSQGDAKHGRRKPTPGAASRARAGDACSSSRRAGAGQLRGGGPHRGLARGAGARARRGHPGAQLYNEGDAVHGGRAALPHRARAVRDRARAGARHARAGGVARATLAQQESERLKGLADRRAISQKEADQAASAAQPVERRGAGGAGARAPGRAQPLVHHRRPRRSAASPAARCSRSAAWSRRPTIRRCSPRSRAATRSGCASRSPRPSSPRVRSGEQKDHRGAARARRRQALPAGRQAQLLRLDGRRRRPARCRCAPSCPTRSSRSCPGQYVRVRVIAGTQQAIVVPQTAVMQNESGRFVWVAADGKAAQRHDPRRQLARQRLDGARRPEAAATR